MTSATTNKVMHIFPVLPCQFSGQISHSLTSHRKKRTIGNVIHQVTKLMSIRVRKLSRTTSMTDCHHRFTQNPVRIGEAGIHRIPSQVPFYPCHRMLRTTYIPQLIEYRIPIFCLRIEKGCNIPIVKRYI